MQIFQWEHRTFCYPRILPKNKQNNLTIVLLGKKNEFVCSLFRRIIGLKKTLQLCLTFSNVKSCSGRVQLLLQCFPFSEFFYKLIRLSLQSFIIKSDNEIGKFSYRDMECPSQTWPLYGYCLKDRYVEGLNFPCAAIPKLPWKTIRKPNLHFSFTFLEWIVPV